MVFDRSLFIEKFKTETREHVQNLNQGLLKLEKSPLDKELLEALMREVHSIKGTASMMGYKRIADIAHAVEGGLQKLMDEKIKMEKRHFDTMFKCIDALEPLLEDKLTWQDRGVAWPYVENLCREVAEVFKEGKKLQGEPIQKTQGSDVSALAPSVSWPIQPRSSLSVPKEQPAEQAKAAAKRIAMQEVSAAASSREESIRVDTEKLDRLINLSGELSISKIRLNELVNVLKSKAASQGKIDNDFGVFIKELNKVDEGMELVTSNLENEVMRLRMLPVTYLFNAFPRAMRDLAYEKGKDIELRIKGEDARLDKAIIDEMKDPIMHILRNAIDHGIEPPEERLSANKNKTGEIVLNAYQQGSRVVIEVSDDGRGIDVNKVKEQAVKKGFISQEKAAKVFDEQAYQFLFLPGFSTKEAVTDVSGRGIGLDVVREKIAKLKGLIEVVSSFGKGTKFIIKLPLTLAINECLLVASGSDLFAIPIDAVMETIRITPTEIATVEAKEAITVRGHIMPLVRLNDIFGFPTKGIIEKKFFSVIVVQSVEKRIGLLVDELLGRQEIVSKALGDPFKNIRNISGATILGDSRVVLILDIASIIESAEGTTVERPKIQPALLPEKRKRKTILLAEDALSTAMLEKNILESAGFSVVIARDGKEALERASQEKFDLVITDILMPIMDGFELTIRLKKDKIYKDIPVIIVTTRDSDADKRRGLEAGAEAYILKSEFTSEGLLDTIEKLIG